MLLPLSSIEPSDVQTPLVMLELLSPGVPRVVVVVGLDQAVTHTLVRLVLLTEAMS